MSIDEVGPATRTECVALATPATVVGADLIGDIAVGGNPDRSHTTASTALLHQITDHVIGTSVAGSFFLEFPRGPS
jgi:hypothetical protein